MKSPLPEPQPPRKKVLSFLKQIRSDPDNDIPRHALANWLEKNGDPDRAKLIRIRLEIASEKGNSPQWMKTAKEAESLERANIARWRGRLADLKGNWSGGRGLFQLAVEAKRLLAAPWDTLRKCEEWAWVEQLSLIQFNRETLQQIGDCPALADVPRLMLLGERFTPNDVNVLHGWPHLPELHTLDLAVNLQGKDMEGLANWPQLATLHVFSPSSAKIGDPGMEALCRSPYLTQLEDLVLIDAGLRTRSLLALVESGLFSRLRKLHAPLNSLDDTAGQVLAEAGPLPNLRILDLSCNRFGNKGLAALSHTDCPNLAELDLEGTFVGPPGAQALAESPLADNLTFLSLSGCPLRDAGVKALAASPRLKNMTTLDLNGCDIGDEGVAALIASPALNGLTWLDLGENRIGAKTKRAALDRWGACVVFR